MTAHFNQLGEAKPISFIRRGRTYPVDSIGRRWEDEVGRHFLVMVPIEKVYELLFVPVEGRWYLRREGLDRFLA